MAQGFYQSIHLNQARCAINPDGEIPVRVSPSLMFVLKRRMNTGAYIYYKTAEKSLGAANDAACILDSDLFNQSLRRIDECAFTVWSEQDLKWGREEPNPAYWENYFLDHLGEGDYKVSALDEDKLARIRVDSDSFFEKSTCMFERLNKHIGMQMRYLSMSCAFSGDYYTDEQIARITQKGELLSGNNKEAIQARIDHL